MPAPSKHDRRGRKIAFIIISAVSLLVLLAIVYFVILQPPKSSAALLDELPLAYILYDGLTINMDGAPDETFWLRDGFAPSTELAGASDGKGRPVVSNFSLAFERWQARGINMELGLDAQPSCRQLNLKVNGRDAGTFNLSNGYQTLSIPIPDEILASGENLALFSLFGAGDCAATVDHIRFRMDGSGDGGAPGIDQRFVNGAKTEVLGTTATCEMNFYVKLQPKSRLSLELGHDKAEGDQSPGRLRIWCQGETTAGKLLWEGDFSASGQQKLDLEIGNQPNEIVLLSFYIKPRTGGDDWLYLANPVLSCPKITGKDEAQPAPLVMDKSKPRTIVLIFEDALRRDMLPTYGNEFIKTPNLDEIAKSATVFENCYSPSNWTFPSFSSIFTAQQFTKTGIIRKMIRMVDTIPTLAGELDRNGWNTALLTSNYITGPKAGLSRGYGQVFELYHLLGHEAPIFAEECLPILTQYLASVPPQEDIFVTMHLMDTHEPYTIPDEDKNYYESLYSQIAKENPWLDTPPANFTKEQVRNKVISICSAIGYFDAILPEIIKAVGAYRDPSNTIFIFLSDHGEELCDHGDIGHSRTLYEELIHIPLIIWGDGVASGRRTDYVNSIDLMPTILELAAVEVPAGLEGVSFAGLLTGQSNPQPRIIYSAMQRGLYSLKCAINYPWKIIYMDNAPEVYDLYNDPRETYNLYKTDPVIFGYMRGVLHQWWSKIHSGGISENKAPLSLSAHDIEILRGLGYVQ